MCLMARVQGVQMHSEEAPALSVSVHSEGGRRAWILAQAGAEHEGAAQALDLRARLEQHNCRVESSATQLRAGHRLGLQSGIPDLTLHTITAWPAGRAAAVLRATPARSTVVRHVSGDALVSCWDEGTSHGGLVLPVAAGVIPAAVELARRVQHLGFSIAVTSGALCSVAWLRAWLQDCSRAAGWSSTWARFTSQYDGCPRLGPPAKTTAQPLDE